MAKSVIYISTAVLLVIPFALFGQLESRGTHAQVDETRITCGDVIKGAFRFPDRTSPDSGYARRRIVVRFVPSWGLESQIILTDRIDRSIRVLHEKVKQGTPSISDRCNEILKANPKARVEDILCMLSVEREEKIADASITRLFREFSRLSIPADLNTAFTADGTTYEVWVQTVSNEIHLTLSDGAYGEDTATTPIMKWIKALRAEVEKPN